MAGCSRFPDLGGEYKLDYNSDHDIGIINSKNSYLIYGHILDYAYDSVFILTEERPRDSIPECQGKIHGMTLTKCDEAFEKSTFHQYWIINKREESVFDEKRRVHSNVYGPFNKEEYQKKRHRLFR